MNEIKCLKMYDSFKEDVKEDSSIDLSLDYDEYIKLSLTGMTLFEDEYGFFKILKLFIPSDEELEYSIGEEKNE